MTNYKREKAIKSLRDRGEVIEPNQETEDHIKAEMKRQSHRRWAKYRQISARIGKGPLNQVAWTVTIDGEWIDTVFFNPDVDADQVRRALIRHDGYDERIQVSVEE